MSRAIQMIVVGAVLAFVAALMVGFIPTAPVDYGTTTSIVLK